MARAASSGILSRTSGRVGESVLVQTRSGLAVKRRPQYRQFPHPETAAARERLQLAADAWRSLSLAQVEAWRAYAKRLVKRNPVNGESYSPIAYNAFVGLATRFLQANPEGEVPLWPPASDWTGEDVTLSVEIDPVAGAAVFAASGPNSEGAVTEILVQRLPNPRRMPTKFYKSAAIHRFTFGSLEFPLPLEPGAYAFGYRFIHALDGQSTGLELLCVTSI
jgi:hypothetical protein